MSETDFDEAADPGFEPPKVDRILVDDPDPRIEDDPDVEDAPEEEREDPITELTDEERAQFRYLVNIGRRTKTIHVFDHAIVVQSLNCDDELRIGQFTKAHRDSTGFARAYQCATVAAAIRSVDGQSWEQSLAADPDPDEMFERKLKKVLPWHPLTVGKVYDELMAMEAEFADLAEKLGKR